MFSREFSKCFELSIHMTLCVCVHELFTANKFLLLQYSFTVTRHLLLRNILSPSFVVNGDNSGPGEIQILGTLEPIYVNNTPETRTPLYSGH